MDLSGKVFGGPDLGLMVFVRFSLNRGFVGEGGGRNSSYTGTSDGEWKSGGSWNTKSW